jgi:hypothetical protein
MKSSLYLTAQIGFTALTLTYFYFFLKQLLDGVNHTSWNDRKKSRYRKMIIVIPIALATLAAVWSLSGIMADFSRFPFNFLPVLIIPLITSIFVTFHGGFTEVLSHIPPARIIRLQSFRFFVELLLWLLFIDGMLPVQMSFEGRNFDILAGITAPFIAWLAARQKISRNMLIAWNVICLGLLINIVTIAILSTPSPIRVFMEEPSNTVVAHFPVSFLPGLLVPLAYTLHFLSLRQLLTKRSTITSDELKPTMHT